MGTIENVGFFIGGVVLAFALAAAYPTPAQYIRNKAIELGKAAWAKVFGSKPAK
jgi:hypothetical protein